MANDFQISLVGNLNRSETIRSINTTLETIGSDITHINLEIGNITLSNAAREYLQHLDVTAEINNIVTNSRDLQRQSEAIGRQVSEGLNRGINGDRVIDQFRETLRQLGERKQLNWSNAGIENLISDIQSLGVQVTSLNQSLTVTEAIGKKQGGKILNISAEGLDAFGQAIRLTGQYNGENLELIKTIDAVSSANNRAATSTNNFVDKQTAAITRYRNILYQLANSYLDINAAKPISQTEHIDALVEQIQAAFNSVNALREANTRTFTQGKADIETQISFVKQLAKEFQNAETSANALRAKPIEVVRDETIQKINAFISQIEKSNAEVSDLSERAEKLKADLSGTVEAADIRKVLDDLAVAKAELFAINQEFSKTSANKKLQIQIEALVADIDKITSKNPELKEFERIIAGDTISVDALKISLSNLQETGTGDIKVITSQWKEFQNQAKQAGKIIDTSTENLGKIRYNIDTQKYSADVAKIITDLDAFGKKSTSAQTAISELNVAYSRLIRVKDNDKALAANMTEYEKAVAKARNTVKTLRAEQKKINEFANVRLSNSIDDWLRKNTKAAKDYGQQLEEIKRQTEGADAITLKRLRQEFDNVKKAAADAGKLGKSFVQTLQEGATKFSEWVFASGLVMQAIHGLRQMFVEVKNIDTAMTELAKVSEATNKELQKSLSVSIETAKTYGATVDGIIQATADWSRLGYNLPEAQQLAEIATLYKNVGDGIDIGEANTSLISTLKGFQLQTEDALSVIDSFNEVANNYAISSAGIGEALQRSAASFYAANTDLNKSIALITATNEVVQDPDAVGRHICPL